MTPVPVFSDTPDGSAGLIDQVKVVIEPSESVADPVTLVIAEPCGQVLSAMVATVTVFATACTPAVKEALPAPPPVVALITYCWVGAANSGVPETTPVTGSADRP